ncbi:Short-chain collagen C4 [Exaiptasia diaphana]|nr:Short-chain collagen C4 [Exaiptasia diaphana]
MSLVHCKDGKDGAPGKDGNGLPGRDGKNGLPGSRGRDGRDGQHGTPGSRGSPGKRGPRGAQGLRGHPGPKSGGVQYIRWGKTSCPSGANLVYKGRVGGEWYNHPGGGSNYVCLTESPKYWSYTNVLKRHSAFMYGAEYQVHSTHHSNPFHNKNLHDHDVPCAVCFVSNRNAKLMIPATYECPAGWSKEYWGYLMSEHYNHANQRNYICVDQNAEPVKGTIHNRDGALLYGVQGRYLSLHAQRSSRFGAKARLPFKMAQVSVKETIAFKALFERYEKSFVGVWEVWFSTTREGVF